MKSLGYVGSIGCAAKRAVSPVAEAITAVSLWLISSSVQAQVTVGSMVDSWTDSVKRVQTLIIYGALVAGLMAIAYGCKLIVDKSNDRENVKNSHIIAAILGGAFLCAIWFIATVMLATSGGSASDIGKGGSL